MARFRLLAGPVPLHHQVYLDLRAAIDAGEWRPATGCPPERELAERYGCSLITVRRALGDLARERRLERTRGRGHVRHPPADRPRPRRARSRSPRRSSAWATTRRPASSPRGPSPPRPPSPRRWASPIGASVVHLERLRMADGEPLLLEQVFLPEARFPGPARRRPRARLAVRAAQRALRHQRRPGPGGARADRPPGAGGPAAGRRAAPAGAAHRRPGVRPSAAGPSSSRARTSGATGRATTWSGSSSAPAPIRRRRRRRRGRRDRGGPPTP